MLSNKGMPLIPSRRISSSGSRHQGSAAQQQQQLQAQRAAAAASAAAAVKRLTGRDLEHLQQLHAFFSGLVDDMAAAVQRLALQGFNQWLVSEQSRHAVIHRRHTEDVKQAFSKQFADTKVYNKHSAGSQQELAACRRSYQDAGWCRA
jgi:phosphoserine phosphatase